jgi:hypothetical protein
MDSSPYQDDCHAQVLHGSSRALRYEEILMAEAIVCLSIINEQTAIINDWIW